MTTDATNTLSVIGTAVGVVSLVCVVILSIIVLLLWCRLRKIKGHLLSYKYQLEKIESQSAKVMDPNLLPLTPLDARPTSPASEPRPIITDDVPRAGYASVNALSLLPDSARTVENLEGETISTKADQEKLLEKFRKDRQEYEEKQLQICEGMRANRGAGDAGGKTSEKLGGNLAENPATAGSRPKSTPTSEKPDLYNYDVIELPENRERQIVVRDDDEYGQPVDAIQQPVDAIQLSMTEGKSGATPSTVKPLLLNVQQKNVLNAPATGQAYTPVFTPPQKQPEGRGDLRDKRAMSDVSPRHGYVNAGPISENQTTRKDSIENAKAAASNSNTRRMAKEVVEFDPERQRMFRMTSKKGRSKGGEGKSGSDHTDDSGISSDASPVVGGPGGTTDGKGSASTPQSRPVVVQEYAMVNIADKKKNRVGADVTKCEGSGVPKHFAAPPVLSS